jgi:GIY-YIG catalytic domain.
MKQKLVSGVYKIEDINTGAVYVGTADQENGIKKRWSNHSSKLKNNKYEYEELQEAYNDNPNRIKWEILLDTSNIKFNSDEEENDYLEKMENYYINYCNSIDGWHVINKQKKAKRKSKVKDKTKMVEAQTGENNGHCVKLNVEKVKEIKTYQKNNTYKDEKLAEMYNISMTHIRNIKYGERWASVQI